jgi:hypothetical protein
MVVDVGGVVVVDRVHDGSVTTAWVELVTTQLAFSISANPPVDVTTTLTVVGLNGSVPAAEVVAVEYPWVRITGPVDGVGVRVDVTELAMLKFCTVCETALLLLVKLESFA